MQPETSQIPTWLIGVAVAVAVLGASAAVVALRAHRQRQRQRALMQALIDATRTGALTWTYAQGQADRHLVPRNELPKVLGVTLRHVDAHRHEFGDRPAADVRQLIDMLRVEALTSTLPPVLLPVVQRLRDALRDRPELVGELIDRLVEEQTRRNASMNLVRWAIAAACVAGVALVIWQAMR